jgi:phosphatidylserine/phosphatidylglycerophosphate/cardiolipin synthase-like enzyme
MKTAIFTGTLSLGLALVVVNHAQASRHSLSQKVRKAEIEALKAVGRANVPVPVADEVCFSPDEMCDARLAKFIESATTSLDIAVYDINLDQVVHQILVQARKIPVRVLVDRRQSKGSKSLVPLLIKAGAQVRFGKQKGIMHDKFTIADGRMLETGSFNYTHGAADLNQENQVYLATPKIVERYKKRFDLSWNEAFTQ